jgi:hypothetical protein
MDPKVLGTLMLEDKCSQHEDENAVYHLTQYQDFLHNYRVKYKIGNIVIKTHTVSFTSKINYMIFKNVNFYRITSILLCSK